MTQIQSLI